MNSFSRDSKKVRRNLVDKICSAKRKATKELCTNETMLNLKLSIKITHLKTSRHFIKLGFGQGLDKDLDGNDCLFSIFLNL